MSGGGASQTTSMPEWAQPYAQNYLQYANQVANRPYEAYQGEQYAGLNDTQYAGLDAITNRAMNGSQLWNTAQGSLTNTLGGGMLNSNPYLNSMIDASASDVIRNYQRSVVPQLDMLEARGGSFGNSGVASARQDAMHDLSGQLSNMASTMRGQNYDAERGRQMQALGMAQGYANQDYTDAAQMLGAGGVLQNDLQNRYGIDMQNWQNARNYPLQQLQIMGGSLGQNYGSTTTQSGGSTLGRVGGGAMGGAAMGAQIGAMGGPIGMGTGALIGGLMGLL